MTGITDAERDSYLRFTEARLEQIGLAVLSLSADEQHEFFQMVKDHATLLNKVIPGMALFALAAGKEVDRDTEVIRAYRVWAGV